MILTPVKCIQCEEIIDGRLRDPLFVCSIREKAKELDRTISQTIEYYMYALHRWEQHAKND